MLSMLTGDVGDVDGPRWRLSESRAWCILFHNRIYFGVGSLGRLSVESVYIHDAK